MACLGVALAVPLAAPAPAPAALVRVADQPVIVSAPPARALSGSGGDECVGARSLTSQRGIIAVYSHGGTSEQAMSCSWTVQPGVSASHTLALVFERFSLPASMGCSENSLTIRDGASSSSSSLGRHCGAAMPPAMRTTGPAAHVSLQTTYTNVGDGFVVHYEALPACSGSRTLTTSSGILADGFASSTPSAARSCEWRVQPNASAPIVAHVAQLEFDASQQSCADGALELLDAQGRTVQLLCAGSGPSEQLYFDVGRAFTVRYNVSAVTSSTRFTLRYYTDFYSA